MADNIKPGDVVTLTCGGPHMTVMSRAPIDEPGMNAVVWFSGGPEMHGRFTDEEIRRVTWWDRLGG